MGDTQADERPGPSGVSSLVWKGASRETLGFESRSL